MESPTFYSTFKLKWMFPLWSLQKLTRFSLSFWQNLFRFINQFVHIGILNKNVMTRRKKKLVAQVVIDAFLDVQLWHWLNEV